MDLPVERKVFVSYVEEDGDLAQELARGLEAAGYSTWYYQRDCPSGTSYLVEISKAIERCDAFLLLISPHSCDGPDEITGEAVRAYKSRKKKIPVLYQMTHDEFEARQRSSDQIREWGQIMAASSGVAIGAAGVAARATDPVMASATFSDRVLYVARASRCSRALSRASSCLRFPKPRKSASKAVHAIMYADTCTSVAIPPARIRRTNPTAMNPTSRNAICLSLKLYAKFSTRYATRGSMTWRRVGCD